jgi:hypothetical protein
VSWEISANLGKHASADARSWLWELTRDAEVARVVVEIGEAAWSSEPLDLPDDTRHALETDGRSEVLKVLEHDEPPRLIHCDSMGCTSRT